MASSSLGTLTLDLIAKTGGFVQGMTKAERSSARWRKQVKRDMQQIGKAMRVVGAGAVAAAGAFGLMVRQGMESIDAQAKMARQLGASVDGLRALTEAGEDAGVSTEVMQKAMERFNSRLGEARRGTGQAFEALERLGLSANELSNMDADERMATLADRMKALGLDTQEAADVLRQFGIRNGEVVNLLLQGGDAIREAAEELKEFGLTLSDIDNRKIEEANDAMRRMGWGVEAVRNQFAIELSPVLLTIAQQFQEAGKASKGFGDTANSGVENLVASVGFVVDSVEGLKRTFEVTGAAIALAALSAQWAVTKLGESIIDQPVKSLNFLIEGLNKVSGLEIEPIGITQLSKDIDRELALLEGAIAEGKKDIHRILMEPMPSAVFGAALEENKRLQAGRDAGLGMEGGVNTAAIDAANAVADAMKGVTDAANDSADASEDATDKNKDASDAVKGLGDSSARAASALDGIGDIDWGKGALGTIGGVVPEQGNGMRSVRQRIEAGKDLTPYWLEPNPTAKPTWSTDYLTDHGTTGMAKVQGAATSVSSHASTGSSKNLGTLTLKSEEGGSIDVEGASDQLTKWLADTLSGVAAGSR